MTSAVHLRLDRVAASVAVARDAAHTFCPGLSGQRLDDLRLVLSELVANAVVHGQGSTIEVRVAATDGVIRGEVVDDGDGFTVPARPEPDALGGRGLSIVDTLAQDWGVERGSTHVWFEL